MSGNSKINDAGDVLQQGRHLADTFDDSVLMGEPQEGTNVVVANPEMMEALKQTIRQARTLEKAIADNATPKQIERTYRALATAALAANPEGVERAVLELVCASAIRLKRVNWLWPGWVPYGRVTFICGEAGWRDQT